QKGRAALPAMTADYIDACLREIGRVLRPSAYCMRWVDAYQLVEAHHRRIADCLTPVDLIAWDSEHFGMGYRARRCGDYLLVLQRPPIKARSTWSDHGIRDRWREKVARHIHPHAKPVGLIKRLIGAVTQPGDLVVDPCAGSFVVLRAAMEMGRDFIGCDIREGNGADHAPHADVTVTTPDDGTRDIKVHFVGATDLPSRDGTRGRL